MESKFNDIYREPNKAPWTFSEIPQEIQDLVKNGILRRGMKVLEIGCGEGHQAIFLAKSGLKVLAIDSSKNAIKFAKNNAIKEKVKVNFEEKGYNQLVEIQEKFDFIFDWRFLHEITDENARERYLMEVSHLLKSHGKYFSVAFSGDSNFMGEGKLRISPVGIKIYFAKLTDTEVLFKKYFKILDSKHIMVPQKPNLSVKANYLLCEKL
jgi:2-polyprenyl-3-methyl-5-hydroxy-6-metoxy-1,4-benzoquinol methylase